MNSKRVGITRGLARFFSVPLAVELSSCALLSWQEFPRDSFVASTCQVPS